MANYLFYAASSIPSALVPTITSFAPVSAVVGTAVTLTGTRFTGATAVTFNGTASSFTVLNATTINTTVPAGAATGLVRVTTPEGVAVSSSAFGVTTSAPSGAQLVLEGDQQQAGFAGLIQTARPAFGAVVDGTQLDQTLPGLISGMRARLQAARDPQKARRFCLVYVGAADILAGAGATTMEQNARIVNNICQQEGYELIICSLTSLRSAAFAGNASIFDGVRSAFNSRLRLYGTTPSGVNAAAVVDLSSITEIGTYAAGLDTAYFTDGRLWTGDATTGTKGLVRGFQEQAFSRLLANQTAVIVTNAPLFATYAQVVKATVSGGTLTGDGTGTGFGSTGALVSTGFGALPNTAASGTLRGAAEWVYAGPEGGYYVRVSDRTGEASDAYLHYHVGFAGMLTDTASIQAYGNDALLGAGIAINDNLLRVMRIAVDDTNVVLSVAGAVLKTIALTASQKSNPLYIEVALSAATASVKDMTIYALRPVDLSGTPIGALPTPPLVLRDASNTFTINTPAGVNTDYGYEFLP